MSDATESARKVLESNKILKCDLFEAPFIHNMWWWIAPRVENFVSMRACHSIGHLDDQVLMKG